MKLNWLNRGVVVVLTVGAVLGGGAAQAATVRSVSTAIQDVNAVFSVNCLPSGQGAWKPGARLDIMNFDSAGHVFTLSDGRKVLKRIAMSSGAIGSLQVVISDRAKVKYDMALRVDGRLIQRETDSINCAPHVVLDVGGNSCLDTHPVVILNVDASLWTRPVRTVYVVDGRKYTVVVPAGMDWGRLLQLKTGVKHKVTVSASGTGAKPVAWSGTLNGDSCQDHGE